MSAVKKKIELDEMYKKKRLPKKWNQLYKLGAMPIENQQGKAFLRYAR